MSIYKDIILDHYRNPRNFGKLAHATKSVSLYNPLCGDRITMEVTRENNSIKDVRFSGEGCAISQATASMLTDYVQGKSLEELRKIPKEFIMNMIGIELSPNRLKCALLPWEALMKIVTEL